MFFSECVISKKDYLNKKMVNFFLFIWIMLVVELKLVGNVIFLSVGN